ncbi:kappaPI-actitoxin-Ael3a-like [Drosophila navojoa]|uniref:kappaPI-actitoxin-Ael3a-like n=1 Tax=Drosophila navojoa TaxID=7232 RepID=UPI0011BD7119|nr:kappaPI-actitoxin-Ael3a-like [Drosophila navojoa]
MKFILLLACLCLYVATLEAQFGYCRGYVRKNCFGGKNEGHARYSICLLNANARMWWYNSTSQSCQNMAYRGCGGNTNRYCDQNSCLRYCT